MAAGGDEVLEPGGIEQMLADVRKRSRPFASQQLDLPKIAQAVVQTASEHRATWQQWHLQAEAERQVRGLGVPLPELDATVDQIVSTAIQQHSIALAAPDPVEAPAEFQRADGTSVYRVAGSDLFTSAAIFQ